MRPSLTNSYYRIIDAAQNRAAEGLRVIEDVCRLHLEDGLLSSRTKALRHDLTQSLTTINSASLLRCRDVQRDPGTEISEASEYHRGDEIQLVRANAARVQQALRTIEEHVKSMNTAVARQIEQLRYAAYALEKAIVSTQFSLADLESLQLYVLTDGRGDLGELELLLRSLVRAEVGLIQFRDKSLGDRQLIEAGHLLTRMTRDTPTRWIMNDRADLALLCHADGVHVGEDDLPVPLARKIVGVDRIVGVTAHSIEQVTQAVLDGASYVGVGPAFPSATKSFESYATREFLKWVADEIALPAFAIGGIDPHNLEELLDLGIRRIAVSHCVINATQVATTVASLKKKLRVARHPARSQDA